MVKLVVSRLQPVRLWAKEPFWSRSDGVGSLCRELILRRTTSHRRTDPPPLMISCTGVNALVSHLGPPRLCRWPFSLLRATAFCSHAFRDPLPRYNGEKWTSKRGRRKKKENLICNGAQFPSGVWVFFFSLLYKEEVATKHQFPRIACCQRHMRLIYITSLHYSWYILQLVVHRANINYSLVIIHFVLNHCPGAATLTSSPLCLQLFFFNFLLSVSSFNLAPFTASTQTNKQDFLSLFFSL